MKCRGFIVFVFVLCLCYVKGFPHQSTEESDDSAETSETEVVVVVPVATHRADSVSSETSHESHETKSREEDDRGSVSESDETKSPEDEPNIHEDVARFADDVSKMSDEEVRSPVYHPKMGEEASMMVEEASKMVVDKLDDAVTKLIEDTPKLGGDETRSPVFRPKVIDVEKMAEAEMKGAEEETNQPKVVDEKVKEEEAKEDDGKGTEEDESDEDSAAVKFPKTESLCPARPEEITKIESECAEEYKQWKAMRAKKFAQQTAVEKTTEATTTAATTTTVPTTTEAASTTTSAAATTEVLTEPVKLLEINVDETEMETTTNEIADQLMESTTQSSELVDSHDDLLSLATTDDVLPMEAEDELPRTEIPLVEASTMPTTTTATTEMESWMTGRKKRSTKKVIKKRSCYPATCILRKLNLLDSMGQPSIERIQSFAINMTVDEKTNLEQKAVGCVKEINEAMIDASADIGKKVGCVAQKVISCLNKGLMCPIMKVPQ